MSSTQLPTTPGRGRSRFSKKLPTPPTERSSSPLPLLSKGRILPQLRISRRPSGVSKTPNSPRFPSTSTLSSSASSNSSYEVTAALSPSLSGCSSSSIENSESPAKDKPKSPERRFPSTRASHHHWPELSTSFVRSPQKTELWRRRSGNSQQSIIPPDHFTLKIDRSNGCTASGPPQINKQLPQTLASRKPVPVPVPVPAPAPAPADLAPPQPDLMGNKLTKLRNKSLEDSSSWSSQNEVSSKRLRSPDYHQKEDIKSTTTGSSPFGSYEDIQGLAPAIPRKSQSRGTSSVTLSKHGSQSTVSVIASQSSQSSEATTRAPTRLSPHDRQPSETLTTQSDSHNVQSPQPHDLISASKLLTPQQSSIHVKFPTRPPVEEGAIFPGPPLELVHFECYHDHRYMRSSRNTLCPVACMICQKADAEMRWRCTWCCLSACSNCMQVLSSIPGKKLEVCLEKIGLQN